MDRWSCGDIGEKQIPHFVRNDNIYRIAAIQLLNQLLDQRGSVPVGFFLWR
jgi:hypothetical protein